MAAANAQKNWFAIGVSIVVVVVLVALGGLVFWLNNQATAPGAAPEGDIINSETGAISFGEGDDTVATYIDFMCPVCNQFEQAYGEQLQTGAANDDITLEIHPIAILNHMSQNTDYSSRSAGAMYCVAAEAPDSALDFMALLFENQPTEQSAGLTDDQLSAFADQAGAAGAADCIADGTYMKFVEDRTPETPPNANGQIGTPTVTINGERIENSDAQARFAELLG